jgi:hypothetical protein
MQFFTVHSYIDDLLLKAENPSRSTIVHNVLVLGQLGKEM